MHNNYFLVRRVSLALEKKIKGFTLVSAFSQSREELVMEFNDATKSFFIKASLPSEFCCLSFPDSFKRARKNSIDLFNELLMKKVTHIHQFENERSFTIDFENDHRLLFKMHGSRSNIILFKGESAEEIFRNHLDNDFQLKLSDLNRPLYWDKDTFIKQLPQLKEYYAPLGKPAWSYLQLKGFESADLEMKWSLFQETLGQLNAPRYYLLEKEGAIYLSLLPAGKILKEFTDPLFALNDFFLTYTQSRAFRTEKATALRALLDQEKSTQGYLSKNQLKLQELQNDRHYQAWGDLVMANLHRIKTGDEKISVADFYNDNQSIDIPLKRDLSPQRNAEVFYRKGKNQQIEIQKLKEALAKKEKEQVATKAQISKIESASDLKQVRVATSGHQTVSQKKDREEILPFHQFEFKGFKIWVGRNAESNDKLTLKYSHKDDLWLHARDVAGSHVLIKHQAGKTFPRDVIERAAELAAYNSKRKTDSLCPVSVTPKKYVRKRKGDPAGTVVVEREEVVMVSPKL